MEPIPETLEAIKELTRFGDTDVAVALLQMSRSVRAVVPELVGLSLCVVDENLTFTLSSSTSEIAELDALQYIDGGPCVQAAERGAPTAYQSEAAMDEQGWRMFATATAAAGVASTLSLPILRHEQVIAGVNLYAGTPAAFDGLHEQVAAACGAWAPGAITNADLTFSTRLEAARAPDQIRAQHVVDVAVGIIIENQAVSAATACERLEQAAERAGITQAQAARAIIRLLGG